MSHPRAIARRRPLPRITTRRLLALVAASAVALSCVHPEGPRPGLYARLGGLEVGACRDGLAGPVVVHPGRPAAHAWMAGAWRRGGRMAAGVAIRGGQAWARVGGWRAAW